MIESRRQLIFSSGSAILICFMLLGLTEDEAAEIVKLFKINSMKIIIAVGS